MKKSALLLLTSFALINGTTQIVWGPVMDVAPATYGNNYPRVVLDASGNPLVSWGYLEDMQFSRWDGSAFTTPVTINPAGVTIAEMTWEGPDIASNGNKVYAVYKETPEGSGMSDVWCVASTDGGMTWGSPVQIDSYLGMMDISRFPTIATDDDGNPIAAFMRFDPSFMGARWVVQNLRMVAPHSQLILWPVGGAVRPQMFAIAVQDRLSQVQIMLR